MTKLGLRKDRREPPHVVIVGGGFGGLTAAKALDGKPVRVTVVDRTNHHLFQPLPVGERASSRGTASTSSRDRCRPPSRTL